MAVTKYDPKKVVLVTGGLGVAGAVFGGVAGAVAFGLSALLDATWVNPGIVEFLFAGGVGAALGFVCAPLAGWLLLRRVPLGYAFARLTLGTVIGGVIGWFALNTTFLGPILAAAGGFVLTAVLLRFTGSAKATLAPTDRTT